MVKKRKGVRKARVSMNRSKKATSNIGLLFALLLASLTVFGGVFYYQYLRNTTPEPQQIPTVQSGAKPTPIPLPNKSVRYAITQSKHEGPTFTSVTFNPLDAKKDKDLTITAEISNNSDITAVTGTLRTDNGTMQLVFERTGGTALSGVWGSKFKLDDTVLYTYLLTLTAQSSNGTSTINVSPR